MGVGTLELDLNMIYCCLASLSLVFERLFDSLGKKGLEKKAGAMLSGFILGKVDKISIWESVHLFTNCALRLPKSRREYRSKKVLSSLVELSLAFTDSLTWFNISTILAHEASLGLFGKSPLSSSSMNL